MAKKQPDTIRMNLEIDLRAEQIPVLVSMMDNVPGHTDMQYIRDMAESLLEQQASGGVMFSGEECKLVEDSTGVILSTAENLLPFLSAETGMQDGMHRVVVLIDPANYPAYEELARTQERTVDALMQEVVDMVQENEWVYELHPRPRQVLMTEAAAAELEVFLGAKFATGSELFALLRQKLTPIAEAEDDAASLFADDAEPSNVGAEA